MDDANFFLRRELQEGIRTIQKQFFDIIDDLRASDADNFEHLKTLLQDDDLAMKFKLFHDNRCKAIRKRILDSAGDAVRNLQVIDSYDISFAKDVEFKGIPNERANKV